MLRGPLKRTKSRYFIKVSPVTNVTRWSSIYRMLAHLQEFREFPPGLSCADIGVSPSSRRGQLAIDNLFIVLIELEIVTFCLKA